ncbi:MAG: GntR family transcriptional regulator [Bifidobacteriaceae bacterium]|jgi:DNA-binding GntR family transcriptional regulator|nr:GntR family transcriptional regulator [Bifidobacteriaceae bacterium]
MTTPALPESLDRSLLSDQAYELLRAKLIARSFTPGSRLVESEIARQLSVSQAPVRDALRRLAHEGLVLQFPRRGSFVAEVSADEIGEAYALRAALEELAATGAMRNITAELVESLEADVDGMFAAAAEDDVERLVAADIGFHKAIWEASGNRFLSRAWLMVESSMRNLTVVSNRLFFDSLAEVAATHRPLVASLKARHPGTPALFRDHALQTWQKLDAAANSAAEEGENGD